MIAPLLLALCGSQPIPFLQQGFQNVPQSARMRMYWRVFGPAWERSEIDYQLGVMKVAGLGGVMTYFMYPVALDDASKGILNQRFLSPEFLDTFAYAAHRAKSLGLRFGVNGSTGWPFGGAHVPVEDAAKRIRAEYVQPETAGYRLPALREGERYLAAFLGARDVTGKIDNGWIHVPLGTQLTVIILGPTGMQVKRPSFGNEGPVLDHFDKGALSRYIVSSIEPMVDAAGPSLTSIGCDSLEVYGSNASSDLLGTFKAKRGYDLQPHLPDLFDENSPDKADLRFDFWRTMAETTEERFTKPLGEWCAKQGVTLEMEPYGTPPNPLTANAYIQLPTGEHYEWRGFSPSRLVASGAHLTGRKLIGAEAWTWAGIPNRLADTLSDLKLLTDLHFLAGVNDVTGVDFPYSPRSAGSPGWQPYYGPTMNQNNPQWAFFPDLVAYVNRCQWMLRQGEPVKPIAVYLPVEDCFARGGVDQMALDFPLRDAFVTGKPTSEFGLTNALRHHSNLLHNILTHGFDYDGIDFWAMERLAKVKDGRLQAGDDTFHTLILHNLEGMDLPAAQKVLEFCRSGGTVIATRRIPGRVYGVLGRKSTPEMRRIMAELFGANPKSGEFRKCGKGEAAYSSDDSDEFVKLLQSLNEPDATVTPYEPEVSCVHRRTAKADIYFVVNVGPGEAKFSFVPKGSQGLLTCWDPMTGRVWKTPGSHSVNLDLAPRGSMFVVCSDLPFKADLEEREPLESAEAVDLAGPWNLSFDGPDAPSPTTLESPNPWTQAPGGRYFSGMGDYTTRFRWDGKLPRKAVLRFEAIHEAAQVTLNGKPIGDLWNPPLEIDVTHALKEGENRLEVKVANLIVNRVLGQPDEDLAALRRVYGNRFPAPEEKQIMKEPTPSGLIGRVWLQVWK